MTAVDELLAFVTARLSDDEAAARAAMGHADHRWYAVPDHKATDDATVALLVEAEAQDMAHWSVDRRILSSQSSSYPDPDDVPWLVHAARQDPRATLARVAALRALVADIEATKHFVDFNDCWYTCPAATEERDGEASCNDEKSDSCDCNREGRIARRLGQLAAIWAWHADFRAAWAS